MRKLILIKHARPEIVPDVPSDQWVLGPQGEAACIPLAKALRPHNLARLITSKEPKARQTAEILGRELNIPVATGSDLYEHDRSNEPHLETREYLSLMALLFKQPDREVIGLETANEALDRIEEAVQQVIDENEGDIAIISHGTVIALLAHEKAAVEPYGLWRRMGQPSYLVFELPSWKLLESVEKIPV